MGKYVFGIASYNRPDKQYFMQYLRGLGYGKEDIVISTQCEADFANYKRLFADKATVIYRQGKNVCDNKNTLLDTIKDKRIIVASDKVEAVCVLNNGKLKTVSTKEELEKMLDWCYSACEKTNSEIFGVYPVGNAFFMSRSININQLLLGCFIGFMPNSKLRFNKNFPLKEDFEISLRVISSGKRVLRFNNICLKERFHQKGGSYELWHAKGDNVNFSCTQGLLFAFPNLVEPHRTRENELRYIGPTKKINF